MNKEPMDTSGDEEEYKFVDEQNAQYASATKKTAGVIAGDAGNASSRKKLLLIIVAVVVFFCLYKLYGLFTTTPAGKVKNPMLTPAASINMQHAPARLPTPPVASPGMAVKPANFSGATQTETGAEQLALLKQGIKDNAQATENLQQQIAGLTTAISDIQNNVAILTQQLSNLADQEKSRSAPIAKKQVYTASAVSSEHKQAVKKVKKRMPAVPQEIYYIRALIQGRAWLIRPDGATFTISSGDNLPGYGQVQTIDPDKGEVITSSGKIITFMPQDR